MGKSSRKRPSTTEDQRKETHKKARNGVEEDVASDEENDNAANCEKGGKKSEKLKTKNRDSNKKKQTRPSREASDQSDESSAESNSEDEALSKIVKHPKASSSKDKQNNEKKQLSTDVQASDKGEVEKIVTHKQVGDKRKYLVKWKDSSRGETWESSQKVAGICRDLYRSYIAEQEKPIEVEAIISHKTDKHRNTRYLIKWNGNSRGETWESGRKMGSICPDLIHNYMAEVKKQNEVEVEAIISHRSLSGQKQYLIKWKDDDKKENWEYATKMALICPDLIKSYKAECEKRNEVEDILSHKKDKHYFMKYLIKWKDHSRGETWEKHKALLKICSKMLRDYTEKVEKAETNQIKAIIEHKVDHGRSKYLIKWNDKSKVESWETAKKTMAVGPDMLDIFVKMNPDCFPRIPERGPRYTDLSKTKKQSKKSKTKGKESVDEEWDENEEWEVDRILDVWNKKDKSREFLVHWKGYKSKYDSWEPENSLNCPDLIADYMVQLENAQNAVQKELRPLRKPVDRLVDRMTIKPHANDNYRSSKRHDGKMRAIYFDAEE